MRVLLLRALVVAFVLAGIGFLAISPTRAQTSSSGSSSGCCGSTGNNTGPDYSGTPLGPSQNQQFAPQGSNSPNPGTGH